MIVIDEYLAVRPGRGVAGHAARRRGGATASRHWRLLQRVHAPASGQLSRLLAALPGGDLEVIRHLHPEVLQVLDPRPLLDDAAAIAARFGTTGLLIAETLAAGVAYGGHLWFGLDANVGRLVERAAPELGITIHVVT